MTSFNDAATPDCILILFSLALLALAFNPIFRFYHRRLHPDESLVDKTRCPSCGRSGGGENSGDELIGIFKKLEERYYPGLAPRHGSYGEKRVWYEKYKVRYKCKHCGHEWTSYKVIRQ